MKRITGSYKTTTIVGEAVRAFIPHPLPPQKPVLRVDGKLECLHTDAIAAIRQLSLAGTLVPSAEWFLYGFVRKEAVISSQIEGTQATLEDVLTYEATHQSSRAADVEEVCNYVDALMFARGELSKPKGLPLCMRLLCKIHEHLMRGVRGADKQPGIIRKSQNWIGGTRPGNARFVPPPHEDIPQLLGELERWLHCDDPLPPLVRAGLAHVQFETIHPFLDGNGRVGRLLITLLLEHWGLLSSPLLYLSLAFKRHRQMYYDKLNAIRIDGDWEGWTEFFLECVKESAGDAVHAAQRLFKVISDDRKNLVKHDVSTVASIRLLDRLVEHPIITMPMAIDLIGYSKPTAIKAIDALCKAKILEEITGKRRDRVYAYRGYLRVLTEDTGVIASGR